MKKKAFYSIQRRLIAFLLFVSLVPLAAMGCYGIFLLQRHLVNTEKYKISSILGYNVILAKNLMTRAMDELHTMAHFSEVEDIFSADQKNRKDFDSRVKAGAAKIRSFLQICNVSNIPKFCRVSLVGSDGREFFRLEKRNVSDWDDKKALSDYSKDPDFIHLRDSEHIDDQFMIFTSTVIDDEPCIAFLIPMYSRHGQFNGVLLAILNSQFVREAFSVPQRSAEIKLFQEEIFFISQSGDILHTSAQNAKSAKNVREIFNPEIIEELLSFEYKTIYDKKDWVYIHDTIIPGNPLSHMQNSRIRKDYFVVIERISYKVFYATRDYYMNLLQLLLGSFSILSIVTGVYLSRNFLRPINKIIKGTEEIARRNLDYTLTINTNDEFEDLANHFNSMVAELQSTYNSIEQKVIERTKELEDANRLLGETRDVVAREKERLESVLNSTKEGIIMIDREGELVFANRSFHQLFAFSVSPEERSNKWNIRELVTRKEIYQEPERYLREIESLINSPLEVLNGQIIMVLPALRIIEWFSAPVIAEKEAHPGRIIAFRDITREKEVERMKDEFVSIVSHELRTPMTSLGGSLSLVLDGTVGEINEDQRELLDIAKNNTTRLIRLINDILDISKIESGKIKMKQEKVDIEKIFGDSIAGIRSFADEYEVLVKSEISEGFPSCLADKDRLIQVVTNLLSNAIKFSPKKGTVLVRAWTEEEKIYVSVKDDGPGIPPEYREKIFEKFQQVDSSSSRVKGGTGLGLPICRAIIGELEGKLWVESEPGKGSTFTFFIPVKSR